MKERIATFITCLVIGIIIVGLCLLRTPEPNNTVREVAAVLLNLFAMIITFMGIIAIIELIYQGFKKIFQKEPERSAS